MARNEEGEFELLVGTRQLLTLVFILMVMFGVVFSMGYFVGRSAGPETPPVSAAAKPPGAEPLAPGATAESVERPSPGGPVSPGRPPAAAPAPGEAAASRPEPTRPPATAAVQPPTTPESKAPAAPPLVAEPAPGQTFLQIAAVRRPEAELIVEVLKKKGFLALTAPVPGDTLFRVLVGPIQDPAALAKTKADLEQAGFRSILRKY